MMKLSLKAILIIYYIFQFPQKMPPKLFNTDKIKNSPVTTTYIYTKGLGA